MKVRPYWLTTPISEMSIDQWEGLCDGCAKCCLHKVEDDKAGIIYYTNVACILLDLASCRCKQYNERHHLVPECVKLTPETINEAYWLPSTCSYRLVSECKPLPNWHPLVSGDTNTVHKEGHSVLGKVVSQADADDLENHMTDWI